MSTLMPGVIDWMAGFVGAGEWTADEKAQIRHRLGLDGTASVPAATPDLAKQSKLDFLQKWVLNRLVESADGTSVTLYDDDGVTPLKTWAYNATTKIRNKAT